MAGTRRRPATGMRRRQEEPSRGFFTCLVVVLGFVALLGVAVTFLAIWNRAT